MEKLHNKYLQYTQLLIAMAIFSSIYASNDAGENADEEDINGRLVQQAAVHVAIAHSAIIPEADTMMRMANNLAKNGGPELSPQMLAFINCFGALSPDEQRATLGFFNDDTVSMQSDTLALQIIASSFGHVEEARRFLNERNFVANMEGIN